MKLRRVLALLFVCALLCGALPVNAVATAQPRPLINGGFEDGTAAGWTVLSGVTVTAEAAYEGDYGCLLTGDGGWDNLLYQTFTVRPGYTYALRFWYKAMPMGVSWYLLDGGIEGTRLARGWAGNADWTCVTKDFTATTDEVCLLFRCSGSNLAEYVYLDCVEVAIHPCDDHVYGYPCDTDCDVCGEVRDDIGEHTYSYPCDTDCDHCDYLRADIGEHTYSYPCDTDCDYCDYLRTDIGEHEFDHACDTACNHCGFQRPPSGEHTYDYPCATMCNYCGAPRESEGEHTYNDVCDTDCDFCGEVRVVDHFYDYPCAPACNRCGALRTDEGEHTYSYACDAQCDYCDHLRTDIGEHTYDDIYDADCNLCGVVRIPAPKPMVRLFGGGTSLSEDVNGVAFRFFVDAQGGRVNADHFYVKSSASVYPFNDGTAYKLVRMGAVMSNEKNPTMDLDHLTARTIDVKANYLCGVSANRLAFAVRIINIPAVGKNTIISARPYFIYSDGITETVVYGETVTQSYNALLQGV